MKLNFYFTTLALFCAITVIAFPGKNFKSSNAGLLSNAEEIKNGFNKGEFSSTAFVFTENKGQVFGYDGLAHPEVKFVLQQSSTQVFLLEKGIAYQFTRMHYPEGYKKLIARHDGHENTEQLEALQKQIRAETFRMDMVLMGANENARITTEGKSIDYINYYNHNALDVHNYNKIIYHEIYPGIDWVIYTKNGEVKYDFVVKPGADPSAIKMKFKHQEELNLNEDGSFTLKNVMGNVTEKAPLSFQNNTAIETHFVLKENIISFTLGQYDVNQPLVIDPSLLWSTYYGGTSDDFGQSCSTDASANVYLAGYCTSSSLASGGHQNTSAGLQEAFLVKFNSIGTRLWATYYGGPSNDYGYSCSTDASGNVYLAGYAQSTSGIASGAHQTTFGGALDAFLVKFNSAGTRLWATYYGGPNGDFGYSCSTDPSGNVYLAGYSTSSVSVASGGHQNTNGGGQDAFLVKFNSSGTRLWATYYGGTSIESAPSCATDASGNVYLAGYTQSTLNIASGGHQTTFGGLQDAFLVKFNSAGTRLWATFYGGSDFEWGYSCATDASGNVYLAGYTNSGFSGIFFNGFQFSMGGGVFDAFLVKFNSAGTRLWGTYYGGSSYDYGYSCSTDLSGNVYLAGSTDSGNLVASYGYQNTINAGYDAYLVKFDGNGIRLWGTYYGMGGNDYGYSCATDPSGHVYIAGLTDSGGGMGSGGHQTTHGGINDGFLVKFCNELNQPSVVSGSFLACQGSSQNYSVTLNPSATGYTWILPPGWSGTSTTNSITVIPSATGILSVSATNTCGLSQIRIFGVVINSQPSITVNSGTICSGGSFTMIPSGAITYTYSSGSSIVSPLTNTVYTVTGTDGAGCISGVAALSNVTVNPLPTISVNSGSFCSGKSFTMTPSGAFTYTYSSGSSIVSPLTNTVYSVTGTSTAGCVSSIAALSNVTVNASPTIGVNSGSICSGSNFTIIPSGAFSYTYSGGSSIVSPATNTVYSVSGTNTVGCVSLVSALSTVTVHASPTIGVNSGSICSGGSFTMIPSGAFTYTYSSGSSIVSPATNTVYSVAGTSTAGCISSIVALSSVTVNPLPVITVNSGSICSGANFTMTPSGAFTYTYSSGSSIVSPATNTVYSVTGTSTAGCVSSIAALSNVTVHALPVISVNSGSICSGGNFTMTPSGAFTYTYSSGSSIVSPLTNTVYSVAGTSTAGCVSLIAALSSITVHTLPTIVVNSGSICSGGSFTIFPSGALTYTYSSGSSIVSPLTNTVYSVTGTSTTGCISSIAALSTVTVNPRPVITVNSGSICSGKSFTIVPTGANSYTYSGGSNIVSPTSTTNYSVTGTSSLGCGASTAAVSQVTVFALPTISVNSGSICLGQSFTIIPSGALTYTIGGGSAIVSPATNSSYTISGSSAEGCISANLVTANVVVNSLPNISINATSTIICKGEEMILMANGAITYTWNSSTSGNLITVSPAITTTYSANGTDVNGCKNSASFTLSVNECTGINQFEMANKQLLVYPNPNSGEFIIEIPQEGRLIILNSLGQIVSLQDLIEGKNKIAMKELVNGIYFLDISFSGKIHKMKLVKE